MKTVVLLGTLLLLALPVSAGSAPPPPTFDWWPVPSPDGTHVAFTHVVTGLGTHMTVEVVNEGPPMTADLVQSLFTAFTHGQRVSSGLGLGLYIANQIARAHGGSIAAASDEASTRFTVRLPRSV